jgi:nitrite reductase (NO-forming)
MPHSIDLHAAIGPGGGAVMTQTLPGESNTFTFVATTPGLFIYHCGTPVVAEHISNGMYGLILVEPPGGLPHADREFYVVQGEIYTASPIGTEGAQKFDLQKMLDEKPEYLVYNGAVGALMSQHPMEVETGQRVRNLTSSPHVMGEIFTTVYQLGSISSPLAGVQTATVPPGGAAILEFQAQLPGEFGLVDHAITRAVKGLMAHFDVKGEPQAALMHAGPAAAPATGAGAETATGSEAAMAHH